MKALLNLVGAVVLVLVLDGCSSTCCNMPGPTSSNQSRKGPTISGYIDTSVSTHW